MVTRISCPCIQRQYNEITISKSDVDLSWIELHAKLRRVFHWCMPQLQRYDYEHEHLCLLVVRVSIYARLWSE